MANPYKKFKQRRTSGSNNEGHGDAKRTWVSSVSKRFGVLKDKVSEGTRHIEGKLDVLHALWSVTLCVLDFVWWVVIITVRTLWRGLLYVFVAFVAMAVIGGIGLGAIFVSSSSELPSLTDYSLTSMPQDATMYDRDGEVIGVISTSTREPVAFGDISQNAKDAIVSIEDERFYDHSGIDPIGIIRSVYVNLKSWISGANNAQGASTITQQYVRNAYDEVGAEQTITRKLKEMALATELETSMSKDDILDAYLNTIYYGNGQYGIQAASRYYFGHDCSQLTDYEAAMLAAIINAPSIYDPTTDDGKERLSQRADLVLDKMWSLGKLDVTQDELRALKGTDIGSVIHITDTNRVINQPFYYDYVMGELHKTHTDDEIVSGGWQVYTTLSIKDGEEAANLVRDMEARYGDSGVTSAIVDVNVEDGSLNAFCGGTDYDASQYNTASLGRPQTGSTLKPFLYATLMERRGYYTTDDYDHSDVNVAGDDEARHVITSYIPDDGDSSIKNGIIQSDNAMAIHAAQDVGMSNVNDMLHACGFTNDIEDNPIAVIGGQTQGFTPMELATGYATIANKGMRNDLWCVKTITDSLGNEVYEHESDAARGMERETALQLTNAMETAVDQRGDWYDIPFDHDGGWTIAAKSGTTDDKADLWCCGFDTTHAVAVWIGGRDARVDVPTTTPTACREMSDYFYATHQGDVKEDFEAPQYKTSVPAPKDGESVNDYVRRLGGIRLNAVTRYVSPSDGHPDGSIVSVSHMGDVVDRDSSVTVTVARDNVEVPDFVGMSPEDAYDAADGLRLDYSVRYVTSGDATPSIMAQSVGAGEVVPKGSTVCLTVQMLVQQSESTTEQVPYQDSDGASVSLRRQIAELREQNESLQSQLERRTDASASTSTGASNATTTQQVTIPDVTGRTAASARSGLESLGLTVQSTGATSSSSKVMSTTPSAGTSVAVGSTVTIECSG